MEPQDKHLKILIVGTLCAACVWLWMMNILEWLPASSADAVVRQLKYLLGKITALLIGNGAGCWMLWFYEVVFDGNIFSQIKQNPMAASIFAVGVLLVNGLIYCLS